LSPPLPSAPPLSPHPDFWKDRTATGPTFGEIVAAHPVASLFTILGILSIVVCLVCFWVLWCKAQKAREASEASEASEEDKKVDEDKVDIKVETSK
jgi:type VI protein secretion system component VasK